MRNSVRNNEGLSRHPKSNPIVIPKIKDKKYYVVPKSIPMAMNLLGWLGEKGRGDGGDLWGLWGSDPAASPPAPEGPGDRLVGRKGFASIGPPQ